jgi:hypothetical protein
MGLGRGVSVRYCRRGQEVCPVECANHDADQGHAEGYEPEKPAFTVSLMTHDANERARPKHPLLGKEVPHR